MESTTASVAATDLRYCSSYFKKYICKVSKGWIPELFFQTSLNTQYLMGDDKHLVQALQRLGSETIMCRVRKASLMTLKMHMM